MQSCRLNGLFICLKYFLSSQFSTLEADMMFFKAYLPLESLYSSSSSGGEDLESIFAMREQDYCNNYPKYQNSKNHLLLRGGNTRGSRLTREGKIIHFGERK